MDITGILRKGETITANVFTLADSDGLGEISYQWIRWEMGTSVEVSGAGNPAWNGTYRFIGVNCGWRGNGCRNNYQKGAHHLFRNEGGYWNLDKKNVGTDYRIKIVNDSSDTPPTTGWQVFGSGTAPAPTLVLKNTRSLIPGANSSTYDLTPADVGKPITVTVSYTDGHGTAESVTSAAMEAVEQ